MKTYVIRQHDAVDAIVDSLENVFDTLHTLQHNGHLSHGEEPGDVFPTEGGVDEGGDSAGSALGAVDFVAGLATAVLVGESMVGKCTKYIHIASGVIKFRAHVFFSAAKLWCVNGDEKAFAATILGVLDDALGNLHGSVFLSLRVCW